MPRGAVRTVRATRTLAAMMALAAISLPLAACGAGSSQGGDETTAPSRDAGVFFPQQRQGGEALMAEISGKLVLDDEGCLRVEEHPGHAETVPIWPAGYELQTSGGEVRVLDESGGVAARVGEGVFMGGGEIPEGRVTLADGDTPKELFERCPGDYWLVGSEVRVLHQQG